MPELALVPNLEEGSPEWWLWKLEARLRDKQRRSALELYDAYYEGEHRLAFATPSYRHLFGDMLKEFADDWCQLVVDAEVERMIPQGFRFTSTAKAGEPASADDEAWRMFQENNLDGEFQMAATDAVSLSEAYAIVWPGDEEGDEPRITFEHASEVVVAHEPGDLRRRAAALKLWVEDDGTEFAFVYLPDGLYKFRSQGSGSGAGRLVLPAGVTAQRWVRYEPDGETWPLEHEMGVVPVVPLYNEPRLRTGWRTSDKEWSRGRSGIRKVIPIQDALNSLIRNMLTASEYQAHRQRWATGIEPPRDPDTGKLIPAWEAAASTLWVGNPRLNNAGKIPEGAFEPKFGQFDAADLRNFVVGVEMLCQHVASITRTPPHYLNASADRLSGESIKAAETGLVAKVARQSVHFGESLEEIIRLAFLAKKPNDPRGRDMSCETVWKDFETRTESQHIDAVVKKRTGLSVPLEQAWEDAGYSPQQRTRMREQLAAERAEQAAADFGLARLLNTGVGDPVELGGAGAGD